EVEILQFVQLELQLPNTLEVYQEEGSFLKRENPVIKSTDPSTLLWWRVGILLWYFEMIVNNAWLLYRSVRKSDIRKNEFCAQWAALWAPVELISENPMNHRLTKLKQPRECELCKRKGRPMVLTQYMCRACGVAIHPTDPEIEHQVLGTDAHILRKRNFKYVDRESDFDLTVGTVSTAQTTTTRAALQDRETQVQAMPQASAAGVGVPP